MSTQTVEPETAPVELPPHVVHDREIVARLRELAKAVKLDRYHRYTLDGRPLTGVTTVLGALNKPALVRWAGKVQAEADLETAWKLYGEGIPEGLSRTAFSAIWLDNSTRMLEAEKLKREAGDIGTAVHYLVECRVATMLGEPVPRMPRKPARISDEARYVFSGWDEWAARVSFEPVSAEFPVYSRAHNYAGTADVLARATLDGRERACYLLDWKTSSGIYGEHELQNTAYRRAVEEMVGERFEGLLVRLPKEMPTGDSAYWFDEHVVDNGPDDDQRAAVFYDLAERVHPWFKQSEADGLERWKAARR